MDCRIPIDPLLAAFGLPATVQRPSPNDDVITTSIIWMRSLEEAQPFGTDLQRREPRRAMAIPRGQFDAMPRGTRVDAPEMAGSQVKSWQVDGLLPKTDAYFWRVAVIPLATR